MAAVSEAAKTHKDALHRERYAWYKEHGICPRCRNWAEPGNIKKYQEVSRKRGKEK